LLRDGTLFAWSLSAINNGGGEDAMKIYFLLMLISVFVGFSFIPLRAEAKKNNAASPDSLTA
jgi:hypothetical protein